MEGERRNEKGTVTSSEFGVELKGKIHGRVINTSLG